MKDILKGATKEMVRDFIEILNKIAKWGLFKINKIKLEILGRQQN
jgi:hypothetical protein